MQGQAPIRGGRQAVGPRGGGRGGAGGAEGGRPSAPPGLACPGRPVRMPSLREARRRQLVNLNDGRCSKSRLAPNKLARARSSGSRRW